MILSPLAKFANSPERQKQLEKLCKAHNDAANGNADICFTIDEAELDKEIRAAIDKTMSKHFSK